MPREAVGKHRRTIRLLKNSASEWWSDITNNHSNFWYTENKWGHQEESNYSNVSTSLLSIRVTYMLKWFSMFSTVTRTPTSVRCTSMCNHRILYVTSRVDVPGRFHWNSMGDISNGGDKFCNHCPIKITFNSIQHFPFISDPSDTIAQQTNYNLKTQTGSCYQTLSQHRHIQNIDNDTFNTTFYQHNTWNTCQQMHPQIPSTHSTQPSTLVEHWKHKCP